jgi:hypothetical protein
MHKLGELRQGVLRPEGRKRSGAACALDQDLDAFGTRAFEARRLEVRVWPSLQPTHYHPKVDAFKGAKYDLILLHPKHFLPNGAPLPIFNQTTNQWVCYTVQDGELKDSSGNRLAPFEDPAGATRSQGLNPLFFTINAFLKIESHETKYTSQFPRHTLQIIDLVKKLYDLIYFLPTPQPGTRGRAIDEVAEAEAAEAEAGKNKKDTKPVGNPRTGSSLASGSGSSGGLEESEETEEFITTHLTAKSLSRLEELSIEEEVKIASDLLNDRKAPAEERKALGSWFMSPYCMSRPLSQTTPCAHTL